MARMGTIVVSVRFENRKAFDSLVEAAHLAEELAEDMPWNPDAQKIADLIRDGIKSVKCEAS